MSARRTPPPAPGDAFLWRICKALDEPPRSLAAKLGFDYQQDVEPLLDRRHKLAEIDRDEVWFAIAEHVDQQLGYLMAIREELHRARRRDVAKRIIRTARQQEQKRKNPRCKR